MSKWTAKFQEQWTCTRKSCEVLHFVEKEHEVEVQRYEFQDWLWAYIVVDGMGQPWPDEWIEVVW